MLAHCFPPTNASLIGALAAASIVMFAPLATAQTATPKVGARPVQLDAPSPSQAGVWILSSDKGASCRVVLRPQRADNGDYFLGMPAACRHALPALEAVGRWSIPDERHLTLSDPAGKPVLVLARDEDGRFDGAGATGTFVLTPVRDGEQAARRFDAVEMAGPGGFAAVAATPIVSKHVKEAESERETPADLAGRYAVMREKRDTGCMVTLDDKSRVKGGAVRAQLAPGCRDQGIVIFDPSAWQLVKGQLVLTARAGHKTVLEKTQDGLWEKNAKEGGKPLGLKKL